VSNQTAGRPAKRPITAGVFVRVLLLVTLFAVTAVTGCGAKGDGDSDANATAEPIRVGVVVPLSGTVAGSGAGVLGAVKVWADEINAAGGLLGRKVQLLIEDNASDPKTSNEKAKTVLGKGASVVVGPILSAERSATMPDVTRQGVPFLYATYNEGMWYDPLGFSTGELAEQMVKGFAPYLVEKYGPNIYFAGSDYVYPKGFAKWLKQYVEAAGGKIIAEEYVALGTTDFASLITRIQKAKPDVFVSCVVGTDGIALAKQAYDYNLGKSVQIAALLTESHVKAIGPEAAAGIELTFGYFQAIETPANQKFIEAFKSIEPDLPVTTITASTYTIMQLWTEAVKKAGTIDGKKVSEAMVGLTIDSPVGQVTVRDDHHCARTMYIARVQEDGSIKIEKELGLIEPSEDQRQ